MEGLDWAELLESFRGLGGIAENLVQRESSLGRGLFLVNPGLPGRIVVPERLLVPVSQLQLEGGAVSLKPSSLFGEAFRHFFGQYQAHFSWGCGGRLAVEGFESHLRELPEVVLHKLSLYQLLNLTDRHQQAWEQVIFQRFLAARQVPFKGQPMIAPVWELVNHSVMSPPFQLLPTGLATAPVLPGATELTFKYSESSPLFRLFEYGFTCQEATAFSFPLRMDCQGASLTIHCEGQPLRDDQMSLRQVDGSLRIRGLPIGNRSVPEQPYAYLGELLRRIGRGEDAKTLFRGIQQANRDQREELLTLLQGCDSNVAEQIRVAITYELELMAISAL